MTWAEAIVAKTDIQVADELLAALAQAGSAVHGFSDAAPQRGLVAGEATAIAYETQLRAELAMTASPSLIAKLDPAWVDAAMGWFDLPNGTGGKGRILATRAQWRVQLKVTAAAAPQTITSASRIQLQAQNGVIFDSAQDSAVTINAGTSFTGVVKFVARLPGISGNVTPGQITKVISGPAGLSVDLSGSQLLDFAARDDETNAQFIARGLSRWGTISIAGWTRLSFLFLVSLAAPGITRVKIDDSNPDGPGTTRVILAGPTGTASAAEVAAVGALLSSMPYKTIGNPAPSVSAAFVLTVVVSGVIRSDGSNANLLADAKAGLDRFANAFSIGGLEANPGKVELELIQAIAIGGRFDAYGVPGFGGATGQLELTAPLSDVSIPFDGIVAFNHAGLVVL